MPVIPHQIDLRLIRQRRFGGGRGGALIGWRREGAVRLVKEKTNRGK
jgi:hypothetical protein